MKFKRTTSVYLACLFSLCAAQSTKAQIAFEKIYPATINQEGTDVLETADGYIICGATETTIVNDLDVQVTKTDFSGNIVWQKTFGGSKPDYPNGMLKASDGDYFIVGYTQSFGGGDLNNYVIKIHPDGSLVYTKVLGGNGNEEAKEIVATADGNYVIVGSSNSVNLNDNNMELTKIALDGTVIWDKFYGGPTFESARSVKLCPDGGFILAGRRAPGEYSVGVIYIVKTNSNGDSVWSKTYGGPDSYEGKSILANIDGTYTVACDDSSGARDSDVKVMKLDNSGTILWNWTFGGTKKDISKMIQHTSDGGYVVAGISRSFWGKNPDMWMLKLDQGGDTTYSRHFGGPDHEHCYAIRQTSDGGYIAIGHQKQSAGNTDIMFVKTNTMGIVGIHEYMVSNAVLNIFPNPSNGNATIELSGEVPEFQALLISNMLGQVVYSEKLDARTNYKTRAIDLKGQTPGTYFVTFQSATEKITRRLIVN